MNDPVTIKGMRQSLTERINRMREAEDRQITDDNAWDAVTTAKRAEDCYTKAMYWRARWLDITGAYFRFQIWEREFWKIVRGVVA
jgi:hypothetical protein